MSFRIRCTWYSSGWALGKRGQTSLGALTNWNLDVFRAIVIDFRELTTVTRSGLFVVLDKFLDRQAIRYHQNIKRTGIIGSLISGTGKPLNPHGVLLRVPRR